MLDMIPAVILAVVYSFFYTLLGPMLKEQHIDLVKSQILPFLLCFIICTALNFMIFHFLSRVPFGKKDAGIVSKLNKFGERKLFLIVWLMILALWIPAYLILCRPDREAVELLQAELENTRKQL